MIGASVHAENAVRARKWAICNGGDVRICTELIESGQETKENLAIDYNNRGHAYSVEGKYDKAIRDFDVALHLVSHSYQALNNRGVAYLKKGEYGLAVQSFDAAIRIAPNDVFAVNNRAAAYMKQCKYSKAIQGFDAAIRLEPDRASLYCNRSAAKRRIGDTVGGDADAATAKRLGGTDECVVR